MDIGAYFDGSGCEFTVWAPQLKKIELDIVGHPEKAIDAKHIPMEKDDHGYWHVSVPQLPSDTHYRYRLNEKDSWPDPVSRYQPEGVHGPSAVVDHSDYSWQDGEWTGVKLQDYITYELHVGTFTPEGTFESALARLPDLVDLGITAIEVMPVSQFPGARNWGYDGTYPFAVQNTYGGPNAMKQFVDACHQHGIAVILDVVYNHFGPEGNYTGKYGPYTTDKYKTPWGRAINFDDAYCDGVRNYFIENAVGWMRDYHIDALRLDAVHAIYDFSAEHILKQLASEVRDFEATRSYPAYLIAESDLNDPKLLQKAEKGGYEIHSQWSDDFHHALHTRLTGEKIGYYQDYGDVKSIGLALKNRFMYDGRMSSFRRRPHGAPARDLPSHQFVVCNQNHDQVGNRLLGERLSTMISFDALKLAGALTILSPNLPLLFMGEEYGEKNPFLYFVDHSDPHLLEQVRLGRQAEFRDFHSNDSGGDETFFPDSPETFKDSILDWLPVDEAVPDERRQQAVQRAFYKAAIQLRKDCKIASPTTSENLSVETTTETLSYRHQLPSGYGYCLVNFSDRPTDVPVLSIDGTDTAELKLYSADRTWYADPTTNEALPTKLKDVSEVRLAPLSLAYYFQPAISST